MSGRGERSFSTGARWAIGIAALALAAACSRDGNRLFGGRSGSGGDDASYTTASGGDIDTSLLRSGRYHGPPLTSPPGAATATATDNGMVLDSMRAAAEAERLQREAEAQMSAGRAAPADTEADSTLEPPPPSPARVRRAPAATAPRPDSAPPTPDSARESRTAVPAPTQTPAAPPTNPKPPVR